MFDSYYLTMSFLLLCILMNIGILTLFRIYPRHGIDNFQAIVINYIVCVVTGILFAGLKVFLSIDYTETWVVIALGLGAVFIVIFYLMALTTQYFSMTVTSVSSKISLVIPVVFALFVFHYESKQFSVWNYSGLVLALVSIYLTTSGKFGKTSGKLYNGGRFLLPIIVFLFGGLIDVVINYTNYNYLTEKDSAIFTLVIFASAAVIGLVILIIRRKPIRKNNLKGGIALGIINYFAVYFLIKTLTDFNNDGAMVYPMLNMGIILGAMLVSIIYFHEHLDLRKKLGIVVSIIAIFLISYQELFDFFK